MMVFCSLWGLLWLKVKWYLHRVIWKGISHGRFQNQAKYLIWLQNFVSMILKNSIRSGEKKLRLRENISWSFPGSCKSWWQPIKTNLATILVVALHHQSSQKHSVVAPRQRWHHSPDGSCWQFYRLSSSNWLSHLILLFSAILACH